MSLKKNNSKYFYTFFELNVFLFWIEGSRHYHLTPSFFLKDLTLSFFIFKEISPEVVIIIGKKNEIFFLFIRRFFSFWFFRLFFAGLYGGLFF